jgi:hypothetical protein
MFCTLCGDQLAEAPVIDILVTRYRCAKGHRFYQMLTDPADHIPDPSLVREPAGVEGLALIEFWLSNPAARREVSFDLAALCRGIVDRETMDVTPQDGFWPWPVSHCFVCGRPSPRQGADVYMDGYRCDGGHQVWERGGQLYRPEPDDQRLRLSIEPHSWFVARLADNWIKDAEHTTPYISWALRETIRRLRPTLGDADGPPST